jgi:hypothetical protein
LQRREESGGPAHGEAMEWPTIEPGN